MCGIFGRFARKGRLGDPEGLIRATNLLLHRGPDDGAWWTDGQFFLSHRRLSIIDLGGGLQPMATGDGRFVVSFNGEIYNYVELREELVELGAQFRTASDTEVLLHGYRQWGRQLPERLVGMFAFALVDRREQTLFLARDRFGEKPLLLAESASHITFASELAPLVSLPDQPQRVSQAALGDYLCLNYVPGEKTLLDGVTRIPPGGFALFRADRSETGRYYRPQGTPALPKPNLNEAVEELGQRIDDGVRVALRSDVPVTLFLSGGIDSSAVAQSAVHQSRLSHAYCLDFPEASYSEWDNASRVATKLGLELRRVELSPNHLVDIRKLVEHADDPLGDSSALPVWILSQAVASDYKVVLSGDGGDELFAGYLTYQATALHRALSHLPFGLRSGLDRLGERISVTDSKVSTRYKLWRFLRASSLPSSEAHFTFNGTWLPNQAAELMRSGPADMLLRLADRHGLSASPSLSSLQRADASDYLPNDILAKVDRITMAHSLEARAPLLIPEIADYALNLPDALKALPFGRPKRALRELVTRTLGPEVGRAKKQGFSIPVHRWLRGPLRPSVEELLNEGALEALECLDTRTVLQQKQRHMAGEAQLGFELWGLMVLVAWHQSRVQRRPKLPEGPPLRRLQFTLLDSPADASAQNAAP